jgi:hypothetical protein
VLRWAGEKLRLACRLHWVASGCIDLMICVSGDGAVLEMRMFRGISLYEVGLFCAGALGRCCALFEFGTFRNILGHARACGALCCI